MEPKKAPETKEAAERPPRCDWINDFLVRRCARIRREGGMLKDPTQKVKRHIERLVVFDIRRDIGLRSSLFLALALEVAAERRFALRVGPRLEFVRHVLQHFNVRHDTLGLDRTAVRGKVSGSGQPQRTVAGSKRDDGLHGALAE